MMRVLVLPILVSFSFWSCKTTESTSTDLRSDFSAPGAIEVCLQSFNTYGPAYGRSLKKRTAALVEALTKGQLCDFVQFQEVWRDWHYDLLTKEIVKEAPTYIPVNFDQMRNGDGKISGLSTIVLHPIQSKSFHDYPVNQHGVIDQVRKVIGATKAIGAVTVKHPNLQDPITLLNTHTHPTSVPVRVAQAIEMVKFVFDRVPWKGPLLLSGDFNFRPGSLEYKILRQVGLLRDSYLQVMKGYSDGICTYCRENTHYWGGGDRVIDFIFYRSHRNVRVMPVASYINLRKSQGLAMSDHYGLKTNFEFVPNSTPIGIKAERAKELAGGAAAILGVAYEFLRDSDQAKFASTLTYVSGLKHRLENLTESDQIYPYFQTFP